jgi:hypothetical protein
MHDRQNTKELMMRKNWALESGPSCVMCGDDMIESRDHLFFDCSFALRFWSALGIHWDTSQPITECFIRAKQSFTVPCFMEVLVCSTWNIWKERNELIFQVNPSRLADGVCVFRVIFCCTVAESSLPSFNHLLIGF